MKTFSAILLALGSVVWSVMSAPTAELANGGTISTGLNKKRQAVDVFEYFDKSSEVKSQISCDRKDCQTIDQGIKEMTKGCPTVVSLYETSNCTGEAMKVNSDETFNLDQPEIHLAA
ncbi:hypothetical protein BGZ70_003083 [Mortierella alpina]|uniref:Uncharacterized protein n=1 Tax=Mortierella alpina TaxID=64518 RepID=A0A9P6M7A7_MORAP|nr:hypothetical protein BGZ70_003083 [Mortierella alpina]